jgi:4-amino-4-deoxy-L-arabinose transferase-like glycosyltransferase
MDFDFLGLLSLAVVTLIAFVLAKRQPAIATILYVALGIRLLVILLNQNIFIFPDSIGDAGRFEIKAQEWSEKGFLNLVSNIPTFNSFFISWVIAILYSLFGQSELMGQSLSLLFGIGSVFMGWSVAKKLWNQRTANKVGWVLALFPTLILYSCIMLREAYVCFFLLLAINGIIEWIRNRNLKSLILVVTGFIGAASFHEPMLLGLIVFIVIIFLKNIKIILINLKNFRINIKSILVFILLFTIIIFIKDINLSKLGGPLIQLDTTIDRILQKVQDFDKGTAKYPSWAVPKNEIELFYKGPIRIIYFVFAPFPWDIIRSSHIVGMFDGFLYIFLTYLILRNRKIIWADPALRIILLILLAYIFVYGLSIGNFGTGVRHRSKFVIMFILLAAPLLPKFIFFSKKRIKNKN